MLAASYGQGFAGENLVSYTREQPLRNVNIIVSLLSQLIPFASGLYVLRSLSNEMKILLVYFGLALITESINSYSALHNIKNLWLFHFFTIVEYGLLAWVFSSWQRSVMLRRVLRMSIPLFSLMGLISAINKLGEFNASMRSVESLILVAASAYTLFELSQASLSSLFKEPRFWVGSAALVYFAGSLVMFALSNPVLRSGIEHARTVFAIYSILNAIASLIFAGGFICQFQAQRSGGPSSLGPSPS